jgi:hypothetical protein
MQNSTLKNELIEIISSLVFGIIFENANLDFQDIA